MRKDRFHLPKKNPMRLALMTQSCDNQTGIGRIVLSLAREFETSGHEVHLIAQNIDVENSRLRRHYVPLATRFNSLNRLTFRYLTAPLTQSLNCDVVNSFMIGRGASVVTAQSCHKAGMDIREKHMNKIVWRKNVGLFDAVTLADEEFIYSSSQTKRIIAVSNLVKDQIVSYYKVEPDKIAVIPNGVDIQYFSELKNRVDRTAIRREYNFSQDDFVLLFVGNEFDRKGLQYVIQSMGRLQRQDVRLLVVGSDDPTPYQALANRLKLDHRIVFTGGVKGPERLFIAADTFVLPALYEPFGLVILEAMAAGLPVIAAKATGALEGFTEGINGFYLDDPTSVDELTNAIRMMVDDGALRQQIVKANDIAVQEYSWKRIAVQTLDVYQGSIDA